MTVIGLGNDWRTDDGAGSEVARRLGGRVLSGEPIGLVQAFEDEPDVTLVDAVSSGAPAGTVHRFDASAAQLPAELFGASSTHTLGVAEAVELARTLGKLPERVLVYGIEGQSFRFGKGLTPKVEAAVTAIVEELGRA